MSITTGATAQTVCSAGDVSAREGALCPSSGACTISKQLTLGPQCSLDFGDRPLTLSGTGRLTFGSGELTIVTGSFAMQPGAYIAGRGDGASNEEKVGGDLTIRTTGDITLQKSASSRSRIDVSGSDRAGSITIDSGGNVAINGRLTASNLAVDADAGDITIRAAGDLITRAGSEILAVGGSEGRSGRITMEAGGAIDLGDILDVSGEGDGSIELEAGTRIVTRALKGNSSYSHGGYVTMIATKEILVLGPVSMQSNNGIDSEGGLLDLEATLGNVIIDGNVSLEGSGADGDGGNVDLRALGDITITQRASLIVSESLKPTGDVDINAGHRVVIDGSIVANGRDFGGTVNLTAGTDMSITGLVGARGIAAASTGGEIDALAGTSLLISGTLNVGGGPIVQGYYGYSSRGGDIFLTSCSLNVPRSGEVYARASGEGGTINITVNHLITIDGVVNALGRGSETFGGFVMIAMPKDPGSSIRAGAVLPEPSLELSEGCKPGPGQDCANPCSSCGNGMKEGDEECDDGNTLNCDGCSEFCTKERCDPTSPCEVCDPVLGCSSQPRACTPSPAPSPTPTPTGSPTQSVAVPSVTPNPTPSQTALPTHFATATPPASPIGSTPPTASATPSASSSATATPVASATSTAIPSPTPLIPPCVGDCGGDGEVTVEEILTLVNVALGTATVDACVVGDSNSDGGITIEEILLAVGNALRSCD